MAKRPVEPYKPTIPPLQFEEWPRWIDGELHRIEQSLASNPVVMAINGSGVIAIDNTLTTITLAIGDAASIDSPEGNWNPATGEWTVALDGLYAINCNVAIAAFGSGNKTYFGTLELFRDNVAVAPSQIDGGADDVPLGISLAFPIILRAGEVLRMELATLHEQFSGNSAYDYSFSYLRSAIL